jgi:tetratricopeptide (TPR) repeat protein
MSAPVGPRLRNAFVWGIPVVITSTVIGHGILSGEAGVEPILGLFVSFWALVGLAHVVLPPRRFANCLAAFPEWSLFLTLTLVGGLLYAVSGAIRDFGLVPMLVVIVLIDLLCAGFDATEVDLGTIGGVVGIGAVAVVWWFASRPGLTVLPTELPTAENTELTGETVADELVDQINAWPEQIEKTTMLGPVAPGLPPPYDQEPTVLSYTQDIDAKIESRLEESHLLAATEFGGIHLAPLFHLLRHMQHRALLESDLELDKTGRWTLTLRGSNLSAECFSQDLGGKLAAVTIHSTGEQALHDLYAPVAKDLELQRQADPAGSPCNPGWGWRALSLFGLSAIPSGEEAELSVASGDGPGSHEQLVALIRMAVLGAMGRIDPAQLGLFYQQRLHVDSALEVYQRALPFVIRAAYESDGGPRRRRRVAALLMRMAMTEEEIAAGDPEVIKNARRHFDQAVALIPEFPQAYVARADFLLRNTRESFADNQINASLAQQNYAQAAADFGAARSSDASGLEAAVGPALARHLIGFSYLRSAEAESCLAMSLADVSARGQQLQLALQDVQQAQALHVVDLESNALVTFQYVAILQSGNCAEDSLSCVKQAEGLPQSSVQTEMALITTLRECTETGRSYQTLQPSFPYYSHAALAVSYGLEVRQAHLLHHLEGVQDDDDHMWGNVRAAAQRLEQDRREEAKVASAEARQIVERSVRVEEDFQKHLDGFAHSASALWQWDRGCHDGTQTLAQRIDDLKQAETAFEGPISDSSAQAVAEARAEMLAALRPGSDRRHLIRLQAGAVEALHQRPDNVEERLGLAWLQLRLGSIEQAAQNLSIAEYLAPDDAEVRYVQGLAQSELGHWNRAEVEWAYAQLLNPKEWDDLKDLFPPCTIKIGARLSASSAPLQ